MPYAGEYNGNTAKAYYHIKKALRGSKNSIYSDNIRAYKFALESQMGVPSNLLADLKWLEKKVADITSPDNYYWVKILQNIVFTKLAPAYQKRGELIIALQLANYADNMPLKYTPCAWRFEYDEQWHTEDIHQARIDPASWNQHDFSNSFFQFLDMQTPETIQYIASLSSAKPLAKYLNSCGYTSADYLYDL